MAKFNVEKETQMNLVYQGSIFTVDVEKYRLMIPEVGSVNSNNDYFDISRWPISEKHCCGSHGFSSTLGDHCPCCDENKRRYNILRAAYHHAVHIFGLIQEV